MVKLWQWRSNGFVKYCPKRYIEYRNAHYGSNATELIAQGAIMITNQNKTADVESIIFAHPTLSEAIMEAIEDLQNLSIHKI